MLAILLTILLCTGADPEVDTVAVCPPRFLPALNQWISYRESQGHRVRVIPAISSAADIQQMIRDTARNGQLRYVLLAGDADPRAAADDDVRRRCVSTHYAAAKVNVRWGSEPHIATDNGYADLDGDQLPDVAVGRLPATGPAELTAMVERIIAYERDRTAGPWQRRVNLVAGAGGFGAVLDGMLEFVTRQFLTDGIPPGYATTMTYGSWRSPYCPDPRGFEDTVLARLNEGSLFWVYLGHSQITCLEPVHVAERDYEVFSNDSVARLRRTGGAPVALFLSCYTGAFDAAQDCLAERLVRSPHGPIAALGGSRVTMPYAMAVMGSALMEEYFVFQQPTLGDLVLQAKRRVMEPGSDAGDRPSLRHWLDTIAHAVYASEDQLREERLEHLLLFNLLGDPLTALRYPSEVNLTVPEEVVAGEIVTVTGESEIGGIVTVELVYPRGRMRCDQPRRTQPPVTLAEFGSFNRVYFDANEQRWSSVQVSCEPGPFRVELPIPREVYGRCHIRVFVADAEAHALGAVPILVHATEPAAVRIAQSPASERPR